MLLQSRGEDGQKQASCTLVFIQHYPTPEAVQRLSWEEFARRQGYLNARQLPAYYARLQAVQNLALPATVIVFRTEAVWLAHHFLQILHLRSQLRKQIQHLLDAHPDYPLLPHPFL